MKDFLANGRFSRGGEVVADASMCFVGNIDHSIQQIVNSTEYDLFLPLPKELDLAVMDRLACYLPGWEMPKNSTEFLTNNYGFITDYLAEAFHFQFSHTNRYDEVTKRIRLGTAIEGRDEKGIKKTVCAFLKILHPDGPPADAEFEEYVRYAVECRRRVKEQMNKRQPSANASKPKLIFTRQANNWFDQMTNEKNKQFEIPFHSPEQLVLHQLRLLEWMATTGRKRMRLVFPPELH